MHPVMVADPFTLLVQAGSPVSVMVDTPIASIFAVLLTASLTIAGPCVPIVASLTARPSPSSSEDPRMTAVVVAARPPSRAVAAPAHHLLAARHP